MPPRALLAIELEVLSHYAHGKSTEEIGELVQLHKSVVQDHLRVAVRKLGASNRTHAAVVASELGLITTARKAATGPSEEGTPVSKDRPSAEDIRLRAYFHWLREGKPHGHDKEHWALAEDEVNSEEKALKPGERDLLPNPFDQES